jgi:hypothetical protein
MLIYGKIKKVRAWMEEESAREKWDQASRQAGGGRREVVLRSNKNVNQYLCINSICISGAPARGPYA